MSRILNWVSVAQQHHHLNGKQRIIWMITCPSLFSFTSILWLIGKQTKQFHLNRRHALKHHTLNQIPYTIQSKCCNNNKMAFYSSHFSIVRVRSVSLTTLFASYWCLLNRTSLKWWHTIIFTDTLFILTITKIYAAHWLFTHNSCTYKHQKCQNNWRFGNMYKSTGNESVNFCATSFKYLHIFFSHNYFYLLILFSVYFLMVCPLDSTKLVNYNLYVIHSSVLIKTSIQP